VLFGVAAAASLALLAAPTLAGHALDPSQPRYVSVPADLLHVASAAAWVGVLLGFVVVLPRAGAPKEAARRASALALAAVALLAASGVARAVMELSSVSQLWSTSYGRTILVKSALFAVLLCLGYLSRRRVKVVRLELVLIAAVVVAVAVLTELRPGTERAYAPSGSRDLRASSPIVSRKQGASSNAASPLGRSCSRFERRDRRFTVAITPAAPITPPMANDRSLPRRPVSSMRRSYSCG
jgi:hypothetical protein